MSSASRYLPLGASEARDEVADVTEALQRLQDVLHPFLRAEPATAADVSNK
jgi:hypothetical protein